MEPKLKLSAKSKGLLYDLRTVNFLNKTCYLTITHVKEKTFRLNLTDASR